MSDKNVEEQVLRPNLCLAPVFTGDEVWSCSLPDGHDGKHAAHEGHDCKRGAALAESAASPASPAPSLEIPPRPEANSGREVHLGYDRWDWRPTFDKDIANAHFDKLEGIIRELQAQLAAMTEDRDLWRGEHNDDCPNAGLAESRVREAEVAAYRRALEAVQGERLCGHTRYLDMSSDDELGPNVALASYSFAIRDAESAILSLIPTDNQEESNALLEKEEL